MEGPKGSTLISGRNKVALDVLRKEIAAGKKKIAIFYGAGHMPDFQKRLRDDFGDEAGQHPLAGGLELETRGEAGCQGGEAGGQANRRTELPSRQRP